MAVNMDAWTYSDATNNDLNKELNNDFYQDLNNDLNHYLNPYLNPYLILISLLKWELSNDWNK